MSSTRRPPLTAGRPTATKKRGRLVHRRDRESKPGSQLATSQASPPLRPLSARNKSMRRRFTTQVVVYLQAEQTRRRAFESSSALVSRLGEDRVRRLLKDAALAALLGGLALEEDVPLGTPLRAPGVLHL